LNKYVIPGKKTIWPENYETESVLVLVSRKKESNYGDF